MTRTLFVTGTDTGVGKTRVACGLLRAFAARDARVAGMKPVAAGTIDTPEGPRNADALALIAAAPAGMPYATVNPFVFSPAIAPHLAATEAGVQIDIGRILRCHAELATGRDVVVVEGAGGLLVPLDDRHSFADLAGALGGPVLLVVGLRLGCLNHALLTAEALRTRGLRLAGWVGTALDPGFERPHANIATLRQYITAPYWGTVRYRPEVDSRLDALDLDPAAIDAFLTY